MKYILGILLLSGLSASAQKITINLDTPVVSYKIRFPYLCDTCTIYLTGASTKLPVGTKIVQYPIVRCAGTQVCLSEDMLSNFGIVVGKTLKFRLTNGKYVQLFL